MDDLVGAGVAVAVAGALFARTVGPATLAHNVLRALGGRFPRLQHGLICMREPATLRNWAPFLLVGPFPLACLALVDVVFGQFVFYSSRHAACLPLRQALISSVVVAYVFLFVWAWAYVGEHRDCAVPFFKRKGRPRRLTLCRPFDNLGELAVFYLDVGLVSVAVAAYYTRALAADAAKCPSTAIVAFSVLLVGAYWWCFVCAAIEVAKRAYGDVRRGAAGLAHAVQGTRPAGQLDAAGVRERFSVLNSDGNSAGVPAAAFGELVEACGLDVDEDDVAPTRESLAHVGVIEFGIFWDWYQSYTGAAAAEDSDNGSAASASPEAAPKKKGLFARATKKTAKVAAANYEPADDADEAADDAPAAPAPSKNGFGLVKSR